MLRPLPAVATNLTALPTQDMNGKGGNIVQHQTDEYVDVKAYENSHVNNRKAMFLFDLASFSGRNVIDQYVHSAAFSVWAWDSNCDEYHFRLYGFTDTASNDDSRWDEGIDTQSHASWPDRYWGAYQYPSGNGVKHLDTQPGPAKDTVATFGSDLLAYVRWGVGRNPGFGHSATNPDNKVTLLLARVEFDADISGFHTRQTEDGDGYKPRVVLDVRFPEIRVGLGSSNDLASGALYDFGVVPETNRAPVTSELAIDNQLGEPLSSLHVSSMEITGEHAHLFSVASANVYISQGQTHRCSVVFDPTCTNTWGIWDRAWLTIQNNDENERPFTLRLRGEVFPQLRLTEAQWVPPAGVAVTWASRTGRWYTVWTAGDLVAGNWVSNDSVRAMGRVHGWTNGAGLFTQRFYRVEMLP
jgi:hypothetical protein